MPYGNETRTRSVSLKTNQSPGNKSWGSLSYKRKQEIVRGKVTQGQEDCCWGAMFTLSNVRVIMPLVVFGAMV
jgi:hypothetical protein